MQRKKIFISYRRVTGSGWALRIHHSLAEKLDAKDLVLDVEMLERGEDFTERLRAELKQCAALLVLIDEWWLDATEARSGVRKLDQTDDWVRIEIAEALAADDVRVIPVLLQGAQMPHADDLPEPLKALTRRHAVKIEAERYRADIKTLIDALPGRKRKGFGLTFGRFTVALSMLCLGTIAVGTWQMQQTRGPGWEPDVTEIAGSADTTSRLERRDRLRDSFAEKRSDNAYSKGGKVDPNDLAGAKNALEDLLGRSDSRPDRRAKPKPPSRPAAPVTASNTPAAPSAGAGSASEATSDVNTSWFLAWRQDLSLAFPKDVAQDEVLATLGPAARSAGMTATLTGAVPPGLRVRVTDARELRLEGTPSEEGTYKPVLVLKDAAGKDVFRRDLRIEIGPADR